MESWWGVGLLFRSDHSVPDSQALYEESVILVRAHTEDEALQQGAELATAEEVSYEAMPGDEVSWKFVRVTRAFEMIDPEPKVGAEVFSRFLSWHLAAALEPNGAVDGIKREGVEAVVSIEAMLPNGLHDASLLSVAFDTRERELHLELAADISDADAGETEVRPRRGVLTIDDAVLYELPIEALAPNAGQGGLWIESASREWTAQRAEPGKDQSDRFLHELFLRNQNKSIVFSGRSARWEWLETVTP